ncbi:hypothetical protein CDAR_518541 [Caerostris darwini]|uniref:Uncharacterized protein n=1 Tax=Caerostris darwini TaxID=1538125 RepID=A0AAV4UW62_9ARAC|nr:hypothetical protein CDAR_518541 [Caerostris darwini]
MTISPILLKKRTVTIIYHSKKKQPKSRQPIKEGTEDLSFSVIEMESIIKNIGTTKTPGLDNHSEEIVKAIFSNKIWFLQLLNLCFTKGKVLIT